MLKKITLFKIKCKLLCKQAIEKSSGLKIQSAIKLKTRLMFSARCAKISTLFYAMLPTNADYSTTSKLYFSYSMNHRKD